jgi:two-component system, OmpR family, phosphate regulon sensor histidine kinase PhoR
LKSVLDSLNEGVILIGENSEIRMVNKIATDFLGEEFEGLSGKDALSVFRIPTIRKLLESKEKGLDEFDYSGKHFQTGIFSIPKSLQKIIVIRDISEQYTIQKTKTDFVSNVSHELKTPLTLIKGYAETLEVENITQPQREYVWTILRHTDRMIDIIKDLLTLSRIEELKHAEFEPLDLSEVIEGVSPTFEKLSKSKNVLIEYELNGNLPEVLGDRSLLEIAISNLLDNAIKYNKSGGVVLIRTGFSEDRVRLSISDTGIGIQQNELDRIFERFYTVDKARSHKFGGTGLGLSITKHIIMLHDGEISVESELGKGSTFNIILPVAKR